MKRQEVSIAGERTPEQSKGRKRRRASMSLIYPGKTHKANEEERRGHEYY